jgi:hypothetical protein
MSAAETAHGKRREESVRVEAENGVGNQLVWKEFECREPLSQTASVRAGGSSERQRLPWYDLEL